MSWFQPGWFLDSVSVGGPAAGLLKMHPEQAFVVLAKDGGRKPIIVRRMGVLRVSLSLHVRCDENTFTCGHHRYVHDVDLKRRVRAVSAPQAIRQGRQLRASATGRDHLKLGRKAARELRGEDLVTVLDRAREPRDEESMEILDLIPNDLQHLLNRIVRRAQESNKII